MLSYAREDEPVARVVDLGTVIDVLRGKLEFESGEEGRELAVLEHLLRRATADDLPVTHDHRPYRRVGAGAPPYEGCEFKCLCVCVGIKMMHKKPPFWYNIRVVVRTHTSTPRTYRVWHAIVTHDLLSSGLYRRPRSFTGVMRP